VAAADPFRSSDVSTCALQVPVASGTAPREARWPGVDGVGSPLNAAAASADDRPCRM